MKLFCFINTLFITIIFTSCENKTEVVTKPTDTLTTAELADPQIKALTDQINSDPNNPESYFLRSRVFLQNQNFKGAFRDLSMAIALDSSNMKYSFAMADLSLGAGSADGAIQAYSQILKRDPKNMDAILKLSKVYLFQKDHTNSMIHLAKAEELDKNNSEIWFLRGMNLKEMNDTTRSLAAFQRAVTLNPGFYDAYIQLGLLSSSKPSQLAAQYFDNAIRLDSNSVEAYYDKARFFQDRGDIAFEKEQLSAANENYEKAKSTYRELIAKNPQYENAFFNLGFILIRQDSLDKAYRMFDFAIKVAPAYAEAFYYRGLVSREKGNAEQAASDFRQALTLKPDYEAAQRELNNL